MAAIENADLTAGGHGVVDAPEKTVGEVFGAWLFEGFGLHALGVNAGHDMGDGAILAGGVHGLENGEHRPAILSVEAVLQFTEADYPLGEEFVGLSMIDMAAAEIGGRMVF